MDRQARIGDTVLVKSREMTGLGFSQITAIVAGGRRVKDDREQNTLAPLPPSQLTQRHLYSKKSLR